MHPIVRSDRVLYAALACAAGIYLLNLIYYYPFYFDDAYISLRYAERFLEGKGLTWNDGERVEGYSDLLWVLLTAALGKIGMELTAATRVLGILSAMATLLALLSHARRHGLPYAAAGIGLCVFAASPPVAIWSLGGLEANLVMALFAWATVPACDISVVSRKHLIIIGILLGLICLTRPEGPVYTIAVALALFLTLPGTWRARLSAPVIISAVSLLFFLGQLLFRLEYYGQYVANTTLAKVAFTSTHLKTGAYYVLGAYFSFFPVLLYMAMTYNNTRSAAPLRIVLRLAIILVVFSASIITGGGGDLYEGGFRLFVPAIPLIALLFMHGASLALDKKEVIILALVFACHVWLQNNVESNAYAKYRRGEIMARAIGEYLGETYAATQPLVAVGAAGAIPYYSKLPSLDILGLNDAYLTTHRTRAEHFGKGYPGHELFNADYVKMRKPDILVFEIPGMGGSICEQYDCKDLLEGYRKKIIHIQGRSVPLWFRKDSEKVKP